MAQSPERMKTVRNPRIRKLVKQQTHRWRRRQTKKNPELAPPHNRYRGWAD